MTIIPVLLDLRPAHLGADAGAGSLLLLPTAEGSLLGEITRSIQEVTPHRPFVLPTFESDATYERRLDSASPSIGLLTTGERFSDMLATLDPSDALLIVSPSCYPATGIDVRTLCAASPNHSRTVKHLLGFEATSLRTKEFVQVGGDGRVRRIQRYFEPVTWPFPAGVIATLLPVACLQLIGELPLESLDELRRLLTTRGIPSQDIPHEGACLDLADEGAVLALTEHRVMRMAGRRERRMVASTAEASLRSPRATIHSSARLIGPVVVHDGAVVESDALIIGPTILGEGSHVGKNAVVAQCLVLPTSAIAAGVTVRHRVVVARPVPDLNGGQRRHAGSVPNSAPSATDVPSANRYLPVKRLVEPVVAFAALVVLSPLLTLMAVLVKLGSDGPIFYGDRREGKDGLPFSCWKFRTMRTDANAMQRTLAARQQMDGPQFKMDNDPRVTPLGRWLRRLNVDELPQLWNVVRGEMSFVGPRPSPFRENQICVPWRQGRLSVRPGITGLWQVCRRDRALGDFHQWIQYDLLYVRNVSFPVDVKILAATVFTLGGRHAVPLGWILGRRHRAADEGQSREHARGVAVPPPFGVGYLGRRRNALVGSMRAKRWLRVFLMGVCGTRGLYAQANAPSPSLVFSLGTGAAWESNLHLRDTYRNPDQSTRISGQVIKTFRSPVTQLLIGADGEAVTYRSTPDLNRRTYRLRGEGSRDVSPRISVKAAVSQLRALSTEIGSLSGGSGAGAAGIPAVSTTPDVGAALYTVSMVRMTQASAEGTARLSPRTTATLRAASTTVAFDSPLLLAGSSLVISGLLSQRYSPESAILFAADAQEGSSAGQWLAAQSTSMGWQSHRTWGEARVLAGLSRTTNQASASILPSGEAALGFRFGGQQVNVGYSRAVSQAYGRGQFLASDLLSLGVARESPLGALSVGARRVISHRADIDNRDLVTSEAFFTLRRDLAAGASIDTGYLYRERTGAVALSGGGLQVSINYSSAFQ